LSVVYSTECAVPKTASRPVGMMPLLVILFVISYCILTMLVFEQGQTIESQRSLIREMLKDSAQLSVLKDKLARDKAPVNGEQKSSESGVPAAGAKGSDAKGLDSKGLKKETKRPGKSAHEMNQVPEKPAADLEDVRRATRVI
jgi:hypothetical protein